MDGHPKGRNATTHQPNFPLIDLFRFDPLGMHPAFEGESIAQVSSVRTVVALPWTCQTSSARPCREDRAWKILDETSAILRR
jgi:hypothetical protein